MSAVRNNDTYPGLQVQDTRQADGIAAVSLLARKINASLDLQETLDSILESAVELVPCSLAEIDLWDAERQQLILQAISCAPDRSYPLGHAFPPGAGYTGWVIRMRKPLFVTDVDDFEEFQPDILPGELPFKSYIGLPLTAGDTLIGALVMVHDQADSFDKRDFHLLEAFAGQAAIAIQNARIYEELSRRHSEVSALYAVAEAINQSQDMHELMESALGSIIKVTKADAAGVRMLDHQTGILSFVASQGLTDEFLDWIQATRLGEGITGGVAEHGQARLIPDMLDRPVVNPEFRAALVKEGIRSRLEVPLRSTLEILGTLGIASHEPDIFNQEDIDLLTAIGRLLGIAIENEQLRQDSLRDERLAAIGQVATGVAHDLRSPLGGILRSAELLSRAEISMGTRQRLSESIVSLSRRLIATSQQILDYVQGQEFRLSLTRQHLSSFLDAVLDDMQVDMSDQGIELVRAYGYDGDLNMDADRMAQVVYNLVSNARDAMTRGGKLTVSTKPGDERIEIRFEDTGSGVPMGLAERIFDPYFSYGKRHGAGLGLAIAKQIVQAHSGEIFLEKSDGDGTVFIVRLPA